MAAGTHQQKRWLDETVGVYVTNDVVVRAAGDDADSWLNGQVTADVRTLAAGSAVYALAASVKGRVLSDIWAVRARAGLALVLPASCAEQALLSFDKHIIMEDVELTRDDQVVVVTVQGPQSEALVASLGEELERIPVARFAPRPGFDVWVPREQLNTRLSELSRAADALGGGVLDDAGWADAHVLLAVPRAGVDFAGDAYPQEIGLKARAVSFSKGCYLGQEVIYMLENRGQLARRLVQLEGLPAGAQRGDTLLDAEGKRVGEITSVARDENVGATLGLGFVKRASAELGSTVQLGESAVRVRCVIGLTDVSCPVVASH